MRINTENGLMFPKTPGKKRRRKHEKSILHDQSHKQCLLCMVLEDDFSEKPIHDHHIVFGTANRKVSEKLGLKCNLCEERHHEYGPEAVHLNRYNDLLLKYMAQTIFEYKHTRRDWMAAVGKSFLDVEGDCMNKVILMGRLTRDPDIRYSAGDNPMAIARYTLAVDRKFKREGDAKADFIGCVAFGKGGEFAEKYFKQGMRVVVEGRIQTGSYTNKDGNKVYTTDVVVENQEFAESKRESNANRTEAGQQSETSSGSSLVDESGFMNIPDGIENDLPFD